MVVAVVYGIFSVHNVWHHRKNPIHTNTLNDIEVHTQKKKKIGEDEPKTPNRYQIRCVRQAFILCTDEQCAAPKVLNIMK